FLGARTSLFASDGLVVFDGPQGEDNRPLLAFGFRPLRRRQEHSRPAVGAVRATRTHVFWIQPAPGATSTRNATTCESREATGITMFMRYSDPVSSVSVPGGLSPAARSMRTR